MKLARSSNILTGLRKSSKHVQQGISGIPPMGLASLVCRTYFQCLGAQTHCNTDRGVTDPDHTAVSRAIAAAYGQSKSNLQLRRYLKAYLGVQVRYCGLPF
jgi:hypothetical protein